MTLTVFQRDGNGLRREEAERTGGHRLDGQKATAEGLKLGLELPGLHE